MTPPPSTHTTNNILHQTAKNKKSNNPFLYQVSGQSEIVNTPAILGGTAPRLPAYVPLDKLKSTFVFESDAPQGYDNQIYLPALA